MGNISDLLDARVSEIKEYLQLIEEFEMFKSGDVKGGKVVPISLNISTTQQRMLYSGVYLQLYNLIEAIVTTTLSEICKDITEERHKPAELNGAFRREWIKVQASTHEGANPDNSLRNIEAMLDDFFLGERYFDVVIDSGGGGSWDHELIKKQAKKIGCKLEIQKEICDCVMRPVKDGKGALGLVKKYRNDLAHGTISFEECGQGIVASDLREISEHIFAYLGDLTRRSEIYISQKFYLEDNK